jgi:hypothetical protein
LEIRPGEKFETNHAYNAMLTNAEDLTGSHLSIMEATTNAPQDMTIGAVRNGHQEMSYLIGSVLDPTSHKMEGEKLHFSILRENLNGQYVKLTTYYFRITATFKGTIVSWDSPQFELISRIPKKTPETSESSVHTPKKKLVPLNPSLGSSLAGSLGTNKKESMLNSEEESKKDRFRKIQTPNLQAHLPGDTTPTLSGSLMQGYRLNPTFPFTDSHDYFSLNSPPRRESDDIADEIDSPVDLPCSPLRNEEKIENRSGKRILEKTEDTNPSKICKSNNEDIPSPEFGSTFQPAFQQNEEIEEFQCQTKEEFDLDDWTSFLL